MSTPAKKARRVHRHRGKTSPLDKLPPAVRSELARRIDGETISYRSIRDWLKAEHRCTTSIPALSDWRLRRMDGALERGHIATGRGGAAFSTGAREIIVTADGAREVRVIVRTLPPAIARG